MSLSKNNKFNRVLDSLEKYRCSKHGINYVSECRECRRQFERWAHENKVNVVWDLDKETFH